MSLVLLLLSLSLLLYILERSLLIFEHIRIFDIYVILLYSTFFKLIKEYSHKTKKNLFSQQFTSDRRTLYILSLRLLIITSA